jgi:hypothetical protein
MRRLCAWSRGVLFLLLALGVAGQPLRWQGPGALATLSSSAEDHRDLSRCAPAAVALRRLNQTVATRGWRFASTLLAQRRGCQAAEVQKWVVDAAANLTCGVVERQYQQVVRSIWEKVFYSQGSDDKPTCDISTVPCGESCCQGLPRCLPERLSRCRECRFALLRVLGVGFAGIRAPVQNSTHIQDFPLPWYTQDPTDEVGYPCLIDGHATGCQMNITTQDGRIPGTVCAPSRPHSSCGPPPSSSRHQSERCGRNVIEFGEPVRLRCDPGYTAWSPLQYADSSGGASYTDLGKCGAVDGFHGGGRFDPFVLGQLYDAGDADTLRETAGAAGLGDIRLSEHTKDSLLQLFQPKCKASGVTAHQVIQDMAKAAQAPPTYWVARATALISLTCSCLTVRMYMKKTEIRRSAIELGNLVHLAVAVCVGALSTIWGTAMHQTSTGTPWCSIQGAVSYASTLSVLLLSFTLNLVRATIVSSAEFPWGGEGWIE